MGPSGLGADVGHAPCGAGKPGSVSTGRISGKTAADPLAADIHVLDHHRFGRRQVKTPAESKGEWDLYKPTETILADEAWRPMAEEGCLLARQA